MSHSYDHIAYQLPVKKASDYADRALNVLQLLQERCPEVLPVFMSANSILTLSGVRAYDAYHEFYDFLPRDVVQTATEVLAGAGVRVLRSDRVLNDAGPTEDIFELINDESLTQLWQTYQVPGGDELTALIRPGTVYDSMNTVAWSFLVERNLAGAMDSGTLPKAWLHDWWAPHNLRFGMLLGYPGKAIESYLWSEADRQPEAAGQDLLDAGIDYYDKYFAAWPVYGYAPELQHDPQIVAHQRLWSEILRLVYTSDWHKRLEADTIFQEAYHQVKRREESGN